MLQYGAFVLLCVAVRCSVCEVSFWNPVTNDYAGVAECCSVLQHVAMCCRVSQHVAVRCNVLQLQCVAVCCSVLQCVAE